MSVVTYYGAFVGGYEDGYLLDDDERRLVGDHGMVHIRGGNEGDEGDDTVDIIFNNEVGAFEEVRHGGYYLSTDGYTGGIEVKEGEWSTIGVTISGKKKVDTKVYTGSRETASDFYARIGSHDDDDEDGDDDVHGGDEDDVWGDLLETSSPSSPSSPSTPSTPIIAHGGSSGDIDDIWADVIGGDDDPWSDLLADAAAIDAVIPDELLVGAALVA